MAELKEGQNLQDEIVAAVDTGARAPIGWEAKFIATTTFVWALFQLYIASNLPFWLTDVTGISLVVTNSNARLIHLAFGLFLAALAFPLFKKSSKTSIPWYDWLLGITGVACCLYIVVLRNEIAVRAGLPTQGDLIASTVGMIILGITVYRALGLPLLIVASVFVAYVFFGNSPSLPEAIQWKGASYGKAMWHFWMQNEGVFGVALGVSASLIFLFVLFGSILEKAGAGNYFIKIAFALLGHLRGGPAKAAVVASALSGLYSGSSIANVVTTGTFTIPLMKRTGFSPEKAGAVEVASSTNGQLTPPVMGAAAFLIAEFTGISYTDILKHALVPALVSYIALVYIVHLEAMKLNLKGLPKLPSTKTFTSKLIGFLGGFIGISILGIAVYYGLGWIKVAAPDYAFAIVAIGCASAYLYLVWIASKQPDLEVDPPDAPILELPRAGTVAVTGLYFILPIVILIWCIIIERLSPALSALWATVAMIVVVLTQDALKAFFRGSGNYKAAFKVGMGHWIEGMIAGSRNMISIAVATGAAGIIVGTISLTGAHQVVGEFVEFLSGGNLIVMLILVAVMSLILGMGLPTTANYIVVSSLMAPVILTLGAKSGLIVPLIAVHLFVFYFGILADDTPPVGLAAFAAAVFGVAVVAMMLFASATQGFLFVKNRIWESVVLLLVAFTLFRPGFFLDMVSPPFDESSPNQIFEMVDTVPEGGRLLLDIVGADFDTGEITSTTILVDFGAAGEAVERLKQAGLSVSIDGELALVEEPFPGTPFFESIGKAFDYYGDQPVQIASVKKEADRVYKEVFYIPAIVLLAFIIFSQKLRCKMPPG
jgi:TRAP transporter 4TM/12TM fusion protein